jgi:uncharacterized small protein (DUF1192 family)
MIVTSSRTFAHQIQTAATKLGVALPESYCAALDAAQRLNETAPAFDAAVTELNCRAVDLLLKGHDPSADKEVQRLAVARVLSDAGLRQAASDRASALTAQAISTHADEIIDTWTSAVQTDCQVLADAAPKLSDISDLRHADINHLKNTGRLDVWSSAMSAFSRVDQAATGQRAIFAALSVRSERQHQVLAYTDLDSAVSINSVTVGTAAPDCWTVAATGAPLNLANVSEFRERIAIWNGEMERRRVEEEELRKMTGFDGNHRRREAVV